MIEILSYVCAINTNVIMIARTKPRLRQVAEITGEDYNYIKVVVSQGKVTSKKQRKILKTYATILRDESAAILSRIEQFHNDDLN